MEEEKNLVNWADFDRKDSNRIVLKTGESVELGFYGMKQDVLEIEDKENTAEGKIKTMKKIPCLVMLVDYHKKSKVKSEIVFTSKKLIGNVRTYFEKGLLYTRVFELLKTGDGYQTQYSFIPMEEKPK